MKPISILLVTIALLLTGCASQDYALYAKAQSDVDIARHNADAAKYAAMASIAANGDQSAKVAAVMALALGQGGSSGQHAMQAPQPSSALQWAQVLVPSLTSIVGINANMRLGMVQSDNSTKLGMSTNDTFLGVASKIQAPAANVSTDSHNTDSHNTDNHTVNPAPVISTPVVVAPGTKVCTINPTTNVLTCL